MSKVAPTDTAVLITGETGTGKELVARGIHAGSPRADGAFVCVNCAAIPSSLIAAELFGYEKGAFTGATQRHPGRFELAHGGTLFLDEVGELLPETQAMLLRVLQEKAFERIGGTKPIAVDVRVIGATNRDLPAAVQAGLFRQDLFYRLNVFPIRMPALRERVEDIPELVAYFVEFFARRSGRPVPKIAAETLRLFQSYPWPGNIRELQNVIERSMIVCETDTFSVDESWLAYESFRATPPQALSRQPADRVRAVIEEALARTNGRVSGPSGAAAQIGLPASTLESKIRSLKIDKSRFKVR
jgi:transcriptional regulator with GAF, ATPase, and Fis domain